MPQTLNLLGSIRKLRLDLSRVHEAQPCQCHLRVAFDRYQSRLCIDHVRIIVAVSLVVIGEVETIHRDFNLQHIWFGILGHFCLNLSLGEHLAGSKDAVVGTVLETALDIFAARVGTNEVSALDDYNLITSGFDRTE